MNENQTKNTKTCFLIDNRFHFDPVSLKLSDSYNNQSVYMSYKEGQLLHLILLGFSNKRDLMEGLWGQHNMIVSDSSYYKIIHLLRKKLISIGLPKETLRTQSRIGLVCVLPVEMIDAGTGMLRYNIKRNNMGDDNVSQSVFNLSIAKIANIDKNIKSPYVNSITKNNKHRYTIESKNAKKLSYSTSNISFSDKQYNYGITLGLLIIFTNIVFLVSSLYY